MAMYGQRGTRTVPDGEEVDETILRFLETSFAVVLLLLISTRFSIEQTLWSGRVRWSGSLHCPVLSVSSALPDDPRIESIWKSWRRSMGTCRSSRSQVSIHSRGWQRPLLDVNGLSHPPAKISMATRREAGSTAGKRNSSGSIASKS